jgi:hypothetical protein
MPLRPSPLALALALALVAALASAAAAGTPLLPTAARGSNAPRKLRGAAAGRALGLTGINPLNCVLRGKLDVGESLDKGEGVCAGNTELESHEFGLTPDGQIIVWHHDYRTGVETVVWKDPSGLAGDALRFEADGTVVLYDDEGAPLCALGEPTPGLQKPKLVVSVEGVVSVKAAGGSASLWALDAATSECK